MNIFLLCVDLFCLINFTVVYGMCYMFADIGSVIQNIGPIKNWPIYLNPAYSVGVKQNSS